MKIRIPSTYDPDSVLAHEGGCVRIMEQVACEMGNFRDDLRGDLGVPRRRDENAQTWRGEQRFYELPRRARTPRLSHYARVRGHAQELVQDGPRDIPGIRALALALEPGAARGMDGRVFVGGVDEDVGVDDQH